MADTDYLDQLAHRRAALAAELDKLDTERDDAIRAALAAGHSAIDLAARFNLSRARVYQIRDRTR